MIGAAAFTQGIKPTTSFRISHWPFASPSTLASTSTECHGLKRESAEHAFDGFRTKSGCMQRGTARLGQPPHDLHMPGILQRTSHPHWSNGQRGVQTDR